MPIRGTLTLLGGLIMKLVNLTPHKVRIFDDEGNLVLEIQPSGQVARVDTQQVKVGSVGDVPIFATESGPVSDLPDTGEEALYIVSALVRLAVPERADVASPGTLLRDENGQPTGCIGLVVN